MRQQQQQLQSPFSPSQSHPNQASSQSHQLSPTAAALARKVQSQASELTELTRQSQAAQSYVHLLERRLLELVPGHPLPVSEAHMGTPATSASVLITAAVGLNTSYSAGGGVSGQGSRPGGAATNAATGSAR